MGVPAFPAAVVDTIVRFGRSCLGGLHVDWQDGRSGVAPWLTFRSGLRSRWLLWLGLALLVGATAGGVMAGFAGARRMASAHDRFLDRQRTYDVLIDIDCDPDQAPTSSPARPDTSCLDDIRRLPSIADLTIVEGFAGFITTADGRSVQPYAGEDPCPIGAGSVGLLGDRSGRLGVELNEIRIVAGRRADPAAADEVVISKAIADRVGLAPGSVLQVSLFPGNDCLSDPSEWQTPVSLRVVGIGVAPGEVPPPSGDYSPSIHLTPAYVAAQAPLGPERGAFTIPVRLRAGVDAEVLLADIAGTGARGKVVGDLNDLAEPVERGIRVQAVALALGAGSRRTDRRGSAWTGPRTAELHRDGGSAGARRARHEPSGAVRGRHAPRILPGRLRRRDRCAGCARGVTAHAVRPRS